MKKALRVARVVAALAVPVSVLSFTLATPAGAQPTTYSVVCKKLVISSSGTVTASKCSLGNTGSAWTAAQKKASKKLTAPSDAALATGGTLTWNGGGSVTIGTPTSTEIACTPSSNSNCAGYPSTTACKAPHGGYSEETEAVGTPPDGVTATTANTSPVAPNVAAVNDDFEATVCLSSAGTITQAKGQDAYF